MDETIVHYLIVAALFVVPLLIKTRLLAIFVCGMIFKLGVTMAVQDWRGKEGYLEFVNEHWVHSHWIVGVALFAWVAYYANLQIRLWRAGTEQAMRQAMHQGALEAASSMAAGEITPATAEDLGFPEGTRMAQNDVGDCRITYPDGTVEFFTAEEMHDRYHERHGDD